MRRLIPVVTLAAALGGCGGGILSPAGPVSKAEYTILLDALAIMLAIVVPTMLTAVAFAWWFRAGNGRARYRPGWAYSGRLELLVWSIPTLVIVFLGGVIWIGSHRLDPAAPLPSSARPLQVQVISLDWKWLFIYPEQHIASVNQLVAPVGVPLHFSLTSASVMNAFFVPQLGTLIYTMNGVVTQLHLQADRPGNFFGESAQFSGDGFPDMHFTLRAVPQQAFTEWVGATRSRGAALDRAHYIILMKPSINVPPVTFREVEENLFEAVVSQKIPPAPGPTNAAATATASLTGSY